jgi:hypothetical protein
MPSAPENSRSSMLLVEDCFASQDARFLETLRGVTSAKWLASFADRWKKDPRPWARQQIFAYLDLPLNCPGHQPIVKRLFKQAEENMDTELMGAFLAAFDTLVRRVRRNRWHWDRETRQSYTTERLATPRDTIPRDGQTRTVSSYDYRTRKMVTRQEPMRMPRNGRLFTHRTRFYLRRRVWRYFRWLGYARPADYPAAIAPALKHYRDEDLEKGENILDCWSLLNICFRGSEALVFKPDHIGLAEGRSLAELKAAPRFANAWETPEAARVLLGLIVSAHSQLVRMWAIEMFRRVGKSLELTPAELLALLDHEDERVQQFGAELFETQGGLEKLSVTTWLELLRTKNLTALASLCVAFEKHVIGERLTLAQCIELTCVKPVPVAKLGFRFLQARAISPDVILALGALASAQCSVIAGEVATWALARLGTAETYNLNVVSRFFDSLLPETRTAAWAWLVAEGSLGYRDSALWSRLAETPFEDLRLKMVDELERRQRQPDPDRLAQVWSAVLLGVHRGGRQKARAVRQLADAIAAEPARVPALLPVLAVAIRSVRGPEMRVGLAAVMTLLAQRPELADAVREKLPELKFTTESATA